MIRRHATWRLLDALRDTPVVHLQGARQTGKSTLAQSIAAGQNPRTYLTPDTAAVRAAAQADPEGFIDGLDGPTVIDEVQRAPDLALAIKAAVDADRRRTDRTLFGHVLDNFVGMELIKQIGWSDRRCRPYHFFRAESGAEVDLVLEDTAGKLVGIEVKGAVTLRSEALRGLEALAGIAGPRFVRGVVLYTGTAIVPFGKRLHALPINQLWA